MIDPTEYINHSGGAMGADSAFDAIGKEKGFVNHNHYYRGKKTPMGNIPINDTQFEEGRRHVVVANKTLHRKPWGYIDLLSRNWFQVKNSDAIFAIGEIENDHEVKGGTGWAVQMAIDADKPVYLFDQRMRQWNKYDYQDKKFKSCDSPVLTKNYAGIGTRQINDFGIKAITQLYDDTLKQI